MKWRNVSVNKMWSNYSVVNKNWLHDIGGHQIKLKVTVNESNQTKVKELNCKERKMKKL